MIKLNIYQRVTHLLINVFIIIPILFISGCTQDSPFSVEMNEEGVLISENDMPVMFFQKATKSLNGEFVRNDYIHPLYSLKGDTLTEDFPEDHRHHRGIFWAWHQIYAGNKRVADQWACEDFIWDITDVKPSINSDNVSLDVTTLWKSPNFTDQEGQVMPLAEEEALITVYPSTDSMRTIDFEITVTSLIDSLRIGGSEDFKGYGGYSWRVKLPEDLVFYGRDGIVTPKTEQVNAGPWINMNGNFNNKGAGGVVVICHPSNPGFPQPWILRSERSMQNAAYPGEKPILLINSESLNLKYRMIIYEGSYEKIYPENDFEEYSVDMKN